MKDFKKCLDESLSENKDYYDTATIIELLNMLSWHLINLNELYCVICNRIMNEDKYVMF